MARIDDLMSEISEAALKARLQREIAELKKDKKFGLVFEHHLPELAPMYGAPIRRGARVAERIGDISRTYLVDKVHDGVALCSPESGGPTRELPADQLVVVKRFGEPIFPTLYKVESVSRGGDAPHHVLIESDNYHALQLLEWLYAGRIDCIYIDPPYNTGARDWKYNNNYVDNADTWRHSKWLSMMRRRLMLARRLLKPDGVLIVTIDEHEVFHLGMLLEDVFRSYLRHMVSIVVNPKGTGKENFARVDEYAIFCVPDIGRNIIQGQPSASSVVEQVTTNEAELNDEEDEEEDVRDEEEGDALALDRPPFPEEEADLWELRHARRRGGESSYRHQRPNQFYPIWIDEKRRQVVKASESVPLGTDPSFRAKDGLTPLWPIDAEENERCWRLISTRMQQLIDQRRVVLGRYNKQRGTWTVNIWYRKPESKKLKTVWWETKHDAGTHGTTLLHKILGRRDAFPFPKSIYAVRDTIAAVLRNRPEAVILDFFAGSGTTLQSVAMLNEFDGGRRQSILVTNNEVSERKAKQLRSAGYAPGTEEWEAEGICRSVTMPRCKAVITGKRADEQALDVPWTTGRMIRKEVSRTIRALSFTSSEKLKSPKSRKLLAGTLGITQGNVENAERWYIAAALTRDPRPGQAILFDPAHVDEFIDVIVKDGGSHIHTINIAMDEDRAFAQVKKKITEALPPLIELVEEVRSMEDGLSANLDYFRLGLLDPDAVEMGGKFSDLLPTLWLMAGARGRCPRTRASEDFFVFEECAFAVLLRERAFSEIQSGAPQRSGRMGISDHGFTGGFS